MLDKLIEKKDIMIYLKLREKQLKKNLLRIPKETKNPKKIEIARRLVIGREKELKRFKKLTAENKFKQECKKLWKRSIIK